jgi:DNA-binding NtrC family response regulator/pSer/pThr/pTyr-binding forkhead associated (FHA) protein
VAQPSRARLTVETGDCLPPSLDLAPGLQVTIGRSRDNTIALKDDLASRLHAKVYYDNGQWFVRDFGLNGTRINGAKVNGSAELYAGTILQIGETRLRFETVGTPQRRTADESGSGPVSDDPNVTQVTRKPASTVGPSLNRGPAIAPALPGLTVNKPLVQPVSTPAPRKIASAHDGTKIMELPAERELPPAVAPSDAHATGLKLDELTALCRFMAEAVAATDTQAVIRAALEAILRQTTARVAGYLSLEPSDPAPKLVLPERATVDVPLSRKLTERVRQTGKMAWLFGDSTGDRPTDSLSAFADAVCIPLGGDGTPFASLHVYRSGLCFSERDVHFIEAVSGYLAKTVELHRQRRALEAENVRLRSTAAVVDDLIGDSEAIGQLRQQIGRAAPLAINVLIQGESGSGKELVAQALHRNSPRGEGPFVVVNCAAIAPTLLEAELFGYKKGAFSGADRDHPGLFQQADEGTLFLDEVGELSPDCQAKLLRVIEGKPFRPVGGVSDVKVDVRVIAATHRDLDQEVRAGRFRQDLLFRLKVIPIRVPPLREHRGDIPELAGFFLEKIGVQCRRSFRLTPPALDKLVNFSWPGNVRQLKAMLESTAIMSDSDVIDVDQLPAIGSHEFDPPKTDFPVSLDVDELETWAIRRALHRTSGNVSQSAKLLGISRDTLHTKLKKKGIDRGEPLATASAEETVV